MPARMSLLLKRPTRTQRPAVAAAEEDVRDLHDDDGAEAGGGGLQIERVVRRERLAEVPAAGAQDEPIRAHRGGGLHQPEEEIGAGEERPVQQPIGRAGGAALS